MSHPGTMVNEGNAYIMPNAVEALIITTRPDQDDPELVKFGVAAVLSSGRIVPICPAGNHEAAKEKLEKWARVFDVTAE